MAHKSPPYKVISGNQDQVTIQVRSATHPAAINMYRILGYDNSTKIHLGQQGAEDDTGEVDIGTNDELGRDNWKLVVIVSGGRLENKDKHFVMNYFLENGQEGQGEPFVKDDVDDDDVDIIRYFTFEF